MSASSSPDGAWSFGSSFFGIAGCFMVIFQWRTGLDAADRFGSLLPRALSWVNTRAASHRESLLWRRISPSREGARSSELGRVACGLGAVHPLLMPAGPESTWACG